MAPMKRPAAAATRGAGKKAKADPAVGQCKEIADAIEGAADLADEVRGMLSGAVQSCLLTPKENRHSFQERVIQMLNEVLEGNAARAGQEVAALEAKVAEADTEKANREAAAHAAGEALTRQGEVLEATKTALATATSEAGTAKAAKSAAEDAQRKGDAEYEEAAEKKTRLETARLGDYEALKQGTVSAVVRTVKAITKLGKDFGWDANLLHAAETTLGKDAASRGTFDGMVLQQIDDAFNSNIAALTQVLDSGEAGKAERAARVSEATTASTTADERERACKAELATEQQTLKDNELNKKNCEKAVRDFDKDMKRVADDLANAQETQAGCSAIMASFQSLVDRSAEQPAEPEAEHEDQEGTENLGDAPPAEPAMAA